ncbi:SRPBCC family protein [Novosphingobium clariflavum]|uniref:SRPBCC family protein n=1 Tax=Novosphingobium clariflavum TaxID=2029884 RepID=A0ABV6S992_9SPHN|nr:SRPBCC family protein [Novosphingobium clariflavum]
MDKRSDGQEPETAGQSANRRRLTAIAIALGVSLAVYMLARATRSDVVTFSFLLVLPAAVGALAAYLGDPQGTRPRRFYFTTPCWIMLGVVVLSVIVLREGTICVLMLAPLWAPLMLAGSLLTYFLRKKLRDKARHGRAYGLGLLALPLLAMQIEPAIPLPIQTATVTRSAVIDASPDHLWPLLKGIPDVQPGEGRWNLTQDLVGVPRPLGARLVGQGLGATRLARWQHDVAFREVIDTWQPGRRIGWRFVFDDMSHWHYTDRHLLPASTYLRIESGGYRIDPIAPGRSRVTLHTTYRMRTPVNGYAALWGEQFLGDLEENLLALISQRAGEKR